MKSRKTNRLLAALLSLCMVAGMLPTAAFAAAPQACPAHSEHDESCGYLQAVEGSPCRHVHDESCGYLPASDGAPCSHAQGEHDGSCGYAPAADAVPCGHAHDESCGAPDPSGAYPGCGHTHDESCGYAPATPGTACSHLQHDEACGYLLAGEGSPCGHAHDPACGFIEADAGLPCGHSCTLCAGGGAAALSEKPQPLGALGASGLIQGEGYTFNTADGLLTVTTNAGTTNWWSDSSVGPQGQSSAHNTKIKSLVVTDGVTEIKANAFQYCPALASLTLPASLTTIGGYAFHTTGLTGTLDLSHLTELSSIGSYAFLGGIGLTGLTLPVTNGLVIGSSAFKLTSLQGKLVIPMGVTDIQDYAFNNLMGAGDLTLELPQTGKFAIAESAFNSAKLTGKLTIPAGATVIGGGAFAGNKKLTAVDLSQFDGTFSYEILQGCIALSEITFGWNPAKTVPRDAFRGVPQTGTVYHPAGAEGYDPGAFAGGRLQDWAFREIGPPSAPQGLFVTPGDRQITLSWAAPVSNGGFPITKYQIAAISNGSEVWQDIPNSSAATTSYTVTGLTNGTLYTYKIRAVNSKGNGAASDPVYATPHVLGVITGTGYTFNEVSGLLTITENAGSAGWRNNVQIIPATIQSLVIQVGVTAIAAEAFRELPFLAAVTIPDTVTSIGAGAFSGCSSLESVTIPALPGQDAVGAGMFRLCTKLSSVTMKEGTASISAQMFESCHAISSFTVPASVKKIGVGAFNKCTNLRELIFLGSLPAIDTSTGMVFRDVPMFGTLRYPAGATGYDPTTFATGELYSWTFVADGLPSAPRNLTATPGNGQIALSWAAPDNDGGFPITKYQVSAVQSGAAENWKNIPNSGASTTSYTVTGLTNGSTYTCKVRAVNSKGAGAASGPATATPEKKPEPTPAIAIDYGAERLTGFAAGGSYTIGGQPVSPAQGSLALDPAWFGQTLSIVRKGGASTADSAPQQLAIPARPALPTPGKTDETRAGANDGSLTGVSAAMEYRLSTQTDWKAITGATVANLAPGTYEVRVKSTAGGFASLPARVTIAQGPSVTGVAVLPATVSVQKGTTQAFTASVSGANDPPQTVTWRVTGNTSADTRFNGSTLTVAVDETAASLTVTATSVLDSTKSGSATVTVTDTPPVARYAISAAPGTLDFGKLAEGYAQPAARTVTVANTGNREVTLSAPTCTGSDYELGALSNATLAVGASATFTVRPKAALAVGGHNATITIAGGNGASANVAVSFTVETAAPVTYTITFDSRGGSAVSPITDIPENGTVALPTPTRYDHRFNGWFTAAAGGTRFTSSTPVTGNLTLYARWTYLGGDSSDDDDGHDTTSPGGSQSAVAAPPQTPPEKKPQTPPEKKPEPPTQGTVKPAAKVVDGRVEVRVTLQDIRSAIAQARAQAKKAGTQGGGILISIDLTGLQTQFSQLPLTLGKEVYKALVDAGVKSLDIRTDQISLSLDLNALRAVHAGATGDVTIRAEKADASKLSAQARAALGDRPLFELTVTSGGKAISNFGKGWVSVTLPYALQKNEKGGALHLAFIGADGKLNFITDSSYDAAAKALLGRTGHFTVFGIAAKTAPAFTDTAGHWAEDDILFAASRELLSGSGGSSFAPNAAMTRGALAAALGRLAGIDPAGYKTGRFTDVKADAPYAPYVNWAAQKGIMNGVSARSFAPDRAVTRQQAAVILASYAKVMGHTLPVTREAVTFADQASIAAWAASAVKTMQQAGILMGRDGDRFQPNASLTRAEAAALLRRMVELLTDLRTAQGWDKDDSGREMYYENGRPATGQRTIAGAAYRFDARGRLIKPDAALPKKEGYLLYTIRKGDNLWDLARQYGCTVAELVRLNGIENPDLIYVGAQIKIPQ